ncbi:MAG: tetratricopeptide repeat protein [Planctomycetota bacterium]|nr:tetratricopeptide repeat protein [Planctomycetota bacterium]
MTDKNPEADHELGALFPQTEEEMIQFHITDPDLKEPSDTEIQVNTSAILKKLGHKVSITVACAYCKGSLEPGKSCYCAACLAPHHEDCFADYGRCSSCKEVEFVRPKKSEAIELVPMGRRRRSSGFLFGLMIGSVSVAAAVTLTFQLWSSPKALEAPQPRLSMRQKSQLILLQAREKQRQSAKPEIIITLVKSALDGSPRDPDILVEASQVYMSASLFDQAKPLLEEAVKKKPKTYSALFHLHCIEARKDTARAMTMTSWLQQLLATAKKAGDKNQYTLFAEAVENQGKGRWQEALGLYRQIELKDICVVTNTASCYKELGQYNQAIDTLTTAIKIEWQPQLLVDRALLCANVGDYERALRDFNTVIENNPKDGKTLTLKGDVLLLSGRVQEALLEYNRILTLDPKNTKALLKRGDIRYSMNCYKDAYNDFSDSIRIDPRLADAYFKRAQVSSRLGRLDEAKADFDRAIQLDPKNRGGRFALAKFLIKQGENKAALQVLQSLAEGQDIWANQASLRIRAGFKSRKKVK